MGRQGTVGPALSWPLAAQSNGKLVAQAVTEEREKEKLRFDIHRKPNPQCALLVNEAEGHQALSEQSRLYAADRYVEDSVYNGSPLAALLGQRYVPLGSCCQRSDLDMSQ